MADAMTAERIRGMAAEAKRAWFLGLERDLLSTANTIERQSAQITTLLAAAREARELFEKTRDIANGRDSLDGFPRSNSERMRRLSAVAEVSEHALALLDGTAAPQDATQSNIDTAGASK